MHLEKREVSAIRGKYVIRRTGVGDRVFGNGAEPVYLGQEADLIEREDELHRKTRATRRRWPAAIPRAKFVYSSGFETGFSRT